MHWLHPVSASDRPQTLDGSVMGGMALYGVDVNYREQITRSMGRGLRGQQGNRWRTGSYLSSCIIGSWSSRPFLAGVRLVLASRGPHLGGVTCQLHVCKHFLVCRP